MKRILAGTFTGALLMSFLLSAGIDDIVAALKAGNAGRMATYFDNTVEITLPSKSNSFSNNQAEVVLRDFFLNHPVKNFEILHKGENAGAEYCIGTLITKNGNFRTTIYMKQKGNKQVLQEIRFENK